MAPPTPATWTDDHVDADMMNDEIRDVINYLQDPARAYVGRAGSSHNIATNTGTDVQWNSFLYKSKVDHSTSSNNQRMVVEESGLYLVYASIEWEAASAGTRRDASLTLNGDPGQIFGDENMPSLGSVPSQLQVVGTQEAEAGDYFTVRVYQASGSTLGVTTASSFGCLWLARLT